MTSADLTVLQPYCENDMRLLKKISKSIFLRLGEPLTEADYDDFYSIANMTLWQVYNSYDTSKRNKGTVQQKEWLYLCSNIQGIYRVGKGR